MNIMNDLVSEMDLLLAFSLLCQPKVIKFLVVIALISCMQHVVDPSPLYIAGRAPPF